MNINCLMNNIRAYYITFPRLTFQKVITTSYTKIVFHDQWPDIGFQYVHIVIYVKFPLLGSLYQRTQYYCVTLYYYCALFTIVFVGGIKFSYNFAVVVTISLDMVDWCSVDIVRYPFVRQLTMYSCTCITHCQSHNFKAIF